MRYRDILQAFMRYVGYIRFALAFVAVFTYGSIALAFQSSTNYQVNTEQIDSGGNIATSSNYSIEGTIGPFVSGDMESIGHSVLIGGGAGSDAGTPGENQASPEVSSVTFAYTDNGTAIGFATGITPVIGTTTLHVYGTVVDTNGIGTVTNVTTTLYRSGVAGGVSCTVDAFNCYRVASCTVTPSTANAGHYDCVFSLASYADATDAAGLYPSQYWTAQVTVTDTSSFSSNRTGDVEMNSLAALNIPTLVDFGELALGATTSTSTSRFLEIAQAGNAIGDLLLSSSANLTCSLAGYVPKENLKWSITDVGYTNASSTSFSSTPAQAFLNVPRKTSSATSSLPLYFNIGIPAEGVGGTCSGTVLLTVTQGS